MNQGLAIACVAAGVAGLAGVAEARPRMLKGPYLQDLAPTAVTVMWQLEQARPARVIVEGPGGRREQEVTAARISEARIEGLEPSSRYRYRVVVEDAAWEGQLATAPPLGKDVPITFAVIGDSRYGVEQHRKIVERIAREAPDFVLGTGDVVDDGSRQEQWQQFFDVEGPLLRDHAYYPAVGNHDRQGRGRTADSFRSYFSLPDSGAETERYYAFTYATSRILVLDSNIYSFALTDQTAWLERELIAARQDPGVRHIFVVMHHPPFSISLHGGAKDLRERWAPLFQKYGVSAVLSGHDHVYERAEHNGVRYFVTGGGGAPLYPRRPRPDPIDAAAVQRFERAFHFLRIAVTGRRVEVTAIRIDGTTLETTAWTEASAGPPPPPPLAARPVAAPSAAPRPPSAAGTTSATGASPGPGAAPPDPARGDGPPYLWIGLAAVGGLLAAAVAVVRTLRR
jgi:predicted phosphodiesterase